MASPDVNESDSLRAWFATTTVTVAVRSLARFWPVFCAVRLTFQTFAIPGLWIEGVLARALRLVSESRVSRPDTKNPSPAEWRRRGI